MQSLYNKSKADYFFANGVNGLDISSLGPVIPWTPAEITSSLWFDAADSSTITLSGSNVSTWNDKSGNSRNATQATTGNQPVLATNVLNGKNVVRFDGNDDSLNYTGTFFANTSYTVYSVVIRRSSKNTNYFMGGTGTSTNQNLIIGWAANTTFRYAQYLNDIDASVDGYTTPIADMWGTWLDTSTGGGRRIFRNGSQASTNTTTTVLSSYNGATLGRFANFSYYNGDIAEVLGFNRVLTTDDRQKVEGYLAWKWGLVGLLPADHPYKNAAPTAPAPIPTSASHTSDIVTGSNWIAAGYGTQGYVLPNGANPSTATLQVIPSWLKNYSNTFNYFFSDTSNIINRPNKPDNSGTNDFGISIFGSTQFVDFDIEPDAGTRYVSFYMTIDPSAPPDGLQLLIRVINRRYNTELVPFRIYNNTTGGSGISASGGLIAKFQVAGTIRFQFAGLGMFSVGLLHGIFFD